MSQLKVLSLNSTAWNRCYVLIYFRYRERKNFHTCYSSVITDQFTKTSKIGSCSHFCGFLEKSGNLDRSVKRFRNKKAFQYDVCVRGTVHSRGAGVCPGVSVQGVSVQGDSVQRGLYSGGSLCRVGSLSRGSLSRETPSPCEQNNTQV